MARVSSKYTGNGPSDDRFEDRDYTQYTDYPGDDYAEFEDVADEQPAYVEHVDYAEPAEPVEEYAGAHRRSDASDLDDERESAGSTAAAAGGVPKRGLAMILIAVAALLLLWGIFALTQNDDAGNTGSAEETSTAATTAATGATGDQATATATATEYATATDTVFPPAPSTVPGAAEVNDPNNPSDPANPAAPAAPAPAPVLDGGPRITDQNAQVYVYNNSLRNDAATNTAAVLNADYNVANRDDAPELMNMPEQTFGNFPQTTVLYDPNADGARETAETIARQVGGVVAPNNNLPAGVIDLPAAVKGNRQAITVVIAGQ